MYYTQEIWISHTVGYYATGDRTITLYATQTPDDPWPGFNTYGKVGVRHIWVADVRHPEDSPLFVMDSADWREEDGGFIQDGAPTGISRLLTFNQGYADWSFAANMTPLDNLGSVGIIFDYVDDDNFATATLEDDGGTWVVLRRMTEGSWSELATAPVEIAGYPVEAHLYKRQQVVTFELADGVLACASETDGLLGLRTADTRAGFADRFFMPAAPEPVWAGEGASRVEPPGEGMRLSVRPMRPNPFLNSSVLQFRLAESGSVRLRIFDLSGRRVRELLTESFEAGVHRAVWDGRDASGHPLGAGVYLYRLETADQASASGKVVLVR